jgi:hypothetical protein
MARVVLDLNNPEFQKNWFAMVREEQLAVLATFAKIQQMDGTSFTAIVGFAGKRFSRARAQMTGGSTACESPADPAPSPIETAIFCDF